jgi:hypothetical protein
MDEDDIEEDEEQNNMESSTTLQHTNVCHSINIIEVFGLYII